MKAKHLAFQLSYIRVSLYPAKNNTQNLLSDLTAFCSRKY